jgi:hypothetical protein
MNNAAHSSAIPIIAALAALVTLGVVTQTKVSKKTRISTRVVVLSGKGERIPAFFAGLPIIDGYVNGKMYPKERMTHGCRKQPNFVDRAAIALGLERVAKAQIGCNFDTCNGCFIRIYASNCTGACVGTYY